MLALLTLTLVLVTPNFLNMFKGEREREVSRLTQVLRLARNEAVLTGRRQRVWFDLKAQHYEFEKEVDGLFLAYDRPRMMLPHKMPAGLRLVDLMTIGVHSERLRDQRVPIVIDHSGFMDPFMLHMSQGSDLFTMRVDGLSGRIEVLPGDVTDFRD